MHDNLNDAQRDAVFHKDGALLVLAGAGAGKTRVVTYRIAELIRSGVAPEKILAVTFTNKAANEMKERIAHLIGKDFSLSPYDSPRVLPFVGTFHALSLHIIKAFHGAANLPARFSIFDRNDSRSALKRAIQDAGFDPKELEPRRVLAIMGRAKGDALDVKAFRAERASSYIDEAVAEVWERYDAILRKEKALDFDDILLTAYRLLKEKPAVQEFFQSAWSHIHVDEYQDTNRVQYELVRTLSETHGNIAAVGDADQNIYSWRGASIAHILDFEKDFPGASVVVLTENYRSTKTIIQAANDVIAKNIHRKEKELTTKNADGEPITVGGFVNELAEAEFVAEESRRLMKGGRDANSIAVLYRANFQSRVLEEAFLRAGVPYQVLGTRFFERKEIKDALSYLRLAENPESVSDLTRAVNAPTRGIGKVTLARMVNSIGRELSGAQRKKVDDFYALMGRVRTALKNKTPSEAVRFTLMESGMWRAYEVGKGEDEERLENLKELVSVATKYDSLSPEEGIARLLEEAALQSDQDELETRERAKKNGVKLMTVHAAKGLEFSVVFIVGLEDGLFPHERDGVDAMDAEEERRLFYVALTRAEERVYLTYAAARRIFGARMLNLPSEFITELDPALVEASLPSGRDVYMDSLHTDEDETIR